MAQRILAGLLRIALQAAENAQIDPSAISLSAGVSNPKALGPDDSLDATKMMMAVQALAQSIGIDKLPLAMAGALSPERLGALGFAMQAAPTLRDALERFERFHRLASDDISVSVTWHKNGEVDIDIVRELPDPVLARIATEALPAGILQLGRLLTGEHLLPRAVLMPFEPARRADYEAFIGIPVHIEPRSGVRLSFAAAELDRPIPSSDPALLAYMDQRVEQLMADLPPLERSSTVTARTRAMLKGMIQGETPTANAVARRLGMSRRTLYRRLNEEDTSFQNILDELRSLMAQSMLSQGDTDIPEVAFVLGFSEPRAFYRAFKRWTGTTPAQWRHDRHRRES